MLLQEDRPGSTFSTLSGDSRKGNGPNTARIFDPDSEDFITTAITDMENSQAKDHAVCSAQESSNLNTVAGIIMDLNHPEDIRNRQMIWGVQDMGISAILMDSNRVKGAHEEMMQCLVMVSDTMEDVADIAVAGEITRHSGSKNPVPIRAFSRGIFYMFV
jgi:hypothetical protein